MIIIRINRYLLARAVRFIRKDYNRMALQVNITICFYIQFLIQICFFISGFFYRK